MAARISDASTQIYSKHHKNIAESKKATFLASDYDVATALLDLRRQVRISSKTSDTESSTFPSIQGHPITSHSCPSTSLSLTNELRSEGSGGVVEMKSGSEVVNAEEIIPLSSVSVACDVEVRVISTAFI